MQTWSQIQDYFTNLNQNEPSPATRAMVTLVRYLSREPDMMMVHRAVGYEMQDLLLWVTGSPQIVHVQSEDADTYSIYLDNESGQDFYGQAEIAKLHAVIPLVNDMIRQSLTS